MFGLLDLNRGLTLLENYNFWPYEKFSFLLSKKVSFLFRTSRNAIQLKELVLTTITTGAKDSLSTDLVYKLCILDLQTSRKHLGNDDHNKCRETVSMITEWECMLALLGFARFASGLLKTARLTPWQKGQASGITSTQPQSAIVLWL